MRIAQRTAAKRLRYDISVYLCFFLFIFGSNTTWAQSSSCSSTTIDAQNNGASVGININTDCSPCSKPPGGMDGNIGCGIIILNVADILGSHASCCTMTTLVPSTGGGYTFYQGDLSQEGGNCPAPLQADVANNEAVSFDLVDSNGDGLIELTICSQGSGNKSLDVSVDPIQCDDGNCNTTDYLDSATCTCVYEANDLPSCDDHDCTTQDSYNSDTCECENILIETPDCNDNLCNTYDSYDVETCECVHTTIAPPNCDDGICTTIDNFDPETCTCMHTEVSPEACDDGDCTTTDSYDHNICDCVYEEIETPDCDDNNCLTYDFYDPITCSCSHDPIDLAACDDGDCLTIDSYDPDTCECIHDSVDIPDCDDNDCGTLDVYNTSICACENTPITSDPVCDDNDCSTEDSYDTELCDCVYLQIEVAECNDDDCTTEDTYNTYTCECEHTPVAPAHCDDNDCTTNDIYNPETCSCEHQPITLDCDDNDCTTNDTFDPATCDCIHTPVDTSCDDNDCTTIDYYDATTCACEHKTITDQACDDQLCYTHDYYDPASCACVNEPIDDVSCDDNNCATEDNYNYETCECEHIAVCSNVEHPGEIGTSAGNCGPFDPGTITNISAASGGCGEIEYLWAQSPINYPFYANDPNTPWTILDNTNQLTYDPGMLSSTMCFIRCSRTSSCDDYIGESNIVCFTIGDIVCDDNDCTTVDTVDPNTCACIHTVIDAPTCDDNNCATDDIFNTLTCECEYTPICNNVTSGGSIGTSQESCGPTDPGKIESITHPSGVCGIVEYMWLSSPIDVPFTELSSTSPWQIIAGANLEYFEPGLISETTCFIRCSRSTGCDEWIGESNTVCITIGSSDSCDDGDCTTLDTYDPTTCDCVHTSIAPPNCDDNDCTTKDYYDGSICSCVNVVDDPYCNNTYECPTDITVSCLSEVVAQHLPLPDSPCGGTANISASVPIHVGGAEGCDGAMYMITYTVDDGCGEPTTCIQHISLHIDEPIITCPADRTITCFDEITIDAPIVVLGCEMLGQLSVEGPYLYDADLGCMGTIYACKYIVTDICGKSASCEQLWTLNLEAPTLTCAADVTIHDVSDYEITHPSITGCDYNLELGVGDLEFLSMGTTCDGLDQYQIEYTATSVCNQQSNCTQNVYVVNACNGPSITCPPDRTITCVEDIIIEDPVVDSPCGGDDWSVQGPILVSGEIGCSDAVYECIFSVTDDCDNTVTCTQLWTLNVSAPIITCPVDVTLEYIDAFTPGDVAVSGCSFGVVTTPSSPVLVYDGKSCDHDIYEVVYTTIDGCGGSQTCTQKIFVESTDVCAPPSIACPADRTVTCFADIVIEVPMISAPCGGGAVSVDGPTLISGEGCVGSVYECVYNVIDDCEQIASCTQLWTLDIQPPSVGCPVDVTIEDLLWFVPGTPTIGGCTYGIEVTNSDPVFVSSGTGCNDHDLYQVTYVVDNQCGQTISCTQDVYLIAGVSCDAPTITCPADQTVTCFDDITIEQPTFNAPCGGGEVSVVGPTLVPGSSACEGAVFECIYTITDDCGQTATCTQLWTLDVAAPSLQCPADITIQSLSQYIPGHVVVVGCEYGVTVTASEPFLVSQGGLCQGSEYNVVYTAKDLCGRITVCTQVIIVEDNSNTPDYVSVGDYIWSDLNADGIQNDGPMSIVGLDEFTVEIYDSMGNPVIDYNGNVIPAQITNAEGKYAFDFVVPGDYKIKITAPSPTGVISSYNWTNVQVGNDPELDSDFVGMVGTNMAMTDIFTVHCGLDVLSIDAGVVITLPVELVAFSSVYNDELQGAEVEWSVLEESGVINYEVEKSYGNASDFEVISKTISRRGVDIAETYSILDKDVVSGKYYYRLKINYDDGSHTYSTIQVVHISGLDVEVDVFVYPNPAVDMVQVDVQADPAASVDIHLFDIKGKQYNVTVDWDQNTQIATVPVHTLSVGNYILRIKIGDEVYVEKISVVR